MYLIHCIKGLHKLASSCANSPPISYEINAPKEPILNTHTVEAILVLVRVDAC
jgi:hypothetical protein